MAPNPLLLAQQALHIQQALDQKNKNQPQPSKPGMKQQAKIQANPKLQDLVKPKSPQPQSTLQNLAIKGTKVDLHRKPKLPSPADALKKLKPN